MSVESILAIKDKAPAKGDDSKEAMQTRAVLRDKLNRRSKLSLGLFKKDTPWRFTLDGKKSQAFFAAHKAITGMEHPAETELKDKAQKASGKKPAKAGSRATGIDFDALDSADSVKDLKRAENKLLDLAEDDRSSESKIEKAITSNKALMAALEKNGTSVDDLIDDVSAGDADRIQDLFDDLIDGEKAPASRESAPAAQKKGGNKAVGKDDSSDSYGSDYSDASDSSRSSKNDSKGERNSDRSGRGHPYTGSNQEIARDGSRQPHALRSKGGNKVAAKDGSRDYSDYRASSRGGRSRGGHTRG